MDNLYNFYKSNNDMFTPKLQTKDHIGKDTRKASHCGECVYGCRYSGYCENNYGLCGIGKIAGTINIKKIARNENL